MLEKIKIELVENGCPLCHGDLKGNEKILYYCKRCNFLFKRKIRLNP